MPGGSAPRRCAQWLVLLNAAVPKLLHLLWRGDFQGAHHAETEKLSVGVVPDALGELRILDFPVGVGGAACGDIALDDMGEEIAIGQDPGLEDLAAAADGLLEVAGLERNEGALAIKLAAEPVNIASLVESSHLHRRGLSHFIVTLANRIWSDMKGDGLGGWCAVEGSNLWPLPCQGSCLRSHVTLFSLHCRILEGRNG